MKRIGFIGLGIMGKSMARNLMKGGFELSIYARSRAKVEDIIAEGAQFHPTIAGCVKGCEAVITIVGYPSDVEEVYLGQGGILDSVPAGTYLVDMTTSSPKLARTIYERAAEKGVSALDAPVTGGDMGAKNATLSILAGGDRAAYDACLPLFEAMGSNIHYEGPAGYGQHTKLANQIIIAGTLSGVCEALAYAKKEGLDLQTLLDSVSAGAAGSKQLESLAPRILKGDYAPGFFIKHFVKDMRLARDEAEAKGLELEVLRQALSTFEEMERQGSGELGTQALITHYLK